MMWSDFNDISYTTPGPASSGAAQGPGASHHSVSADGSGESLKIADVVPGMASVRLVGVVIAKEESRHFPSKKDPGNERHLQSFTIRDSLNDFINVTCWGGEQFILELTQQFHIGDVVELRHALVQSKPQDGTEERFRPWTPSMCSVSLGEKKGGIAVLTDGSTDNLLDLMHIPTKPSNDYYTISDIMANGQDLKGENINILAAVKSVGAASEVTSKMGKKLIKCEIRLFDESGQTIMMVMWDKELIRLAADWVPREYVIFAADVRATYNDYRKTMTISTNSKTVITVNPNTREAHRLYQFAQTAEIDDDGAMDATGQGNSFVDLNSIHEVYTVEQIQDVQQLKMDGTDSKYGITYAVITSFDIDGNVHHVVIGKCTKCRLRVDSQTGTCTNDDCPRGSMAGDLEEVATDIESSYDVRMAITDHTGSIDSCRLTSDTAATMLGCKAEDFLGLSEEEKTVIKWTFLMERCKIYFKVNAPTMERPTSYVRILSCQIADPAEVIGNLQD